jgi:DNA adenine methylase
VYIDPPYDGTFSQYWSTAFGKQEQRELRDFCCTLDRRGIRFIQSNAPTEEIRELYKDFYLFSFYVGRQMRDARSGKKEREIQDNEILIWNYKKMIFE